jgi:hypothetical protein
MANVASSVRDAMDSEEDEESEMARVVRKTQRSQWQPEWESDHRCYQNQLGIHWLEKALSLGASVVLERLLKNCREDDRSVVSWVHLQNTR